jgi:hypothetical protein
MAIELMQGAAAAKDFVNTYLQADLPRRLRTYRNGWGLDDESLPDPVRYFPYEPIALDRWPTIITVAISTNSIEREDYTLSYDPMYRVRYAMRTYVWVRSGDSADATRMRDNLTTVVRSALLDHQCLRHADNGNREVLLDEGTVREEFSELTLLKGERILAGAYIAYDIHLNEVVARAPLGQIQTLGVEVSMLGEEH